MLKQKSQSILNINNIDSALRLVNHTSNSHNRKSVGNNLPFHLMDTFCTNSTFVHDCLLPTQLLSFKQNDIMPFNYGEDCLLALGIEQFPKLTSQEQANAICKMLIIGREQKEVCDRIKSLRYARMRRGKTNPVKDFYTNGHVADMYLSPWYNVPDNYNRSQQFPNGLIEKVNAKFPRWFKNSYMRSKQRLKSLSTNNSNRNDTTATLFSSTEQEEIKSTVYVVIGSPDEQQQQTLQSSPSQVLQQIKMLHLLNSYPKLKPKTK